MTLTGYPHPGPMACILHSHILFGLVSTQLADAATFTVGVSRFGIGLESNGIAASLQLLGVRSFSRTPATTLGAPGYGLCESITPDETRCLVSRRHSPPPRAHGRPDV